MSAPREGVWFAKPRPVRRTLRKPSEWLVLLALFGMALHVYSELLGRMAYTLLIAVVVYRDINERRALRTLRSDREFSDHAPGIVEHPMEILIVNDGEEIGMDRGFMWIEEGLLHFNGAATSFALAAEDILPRRKIEGKDPYHALPGDCIRLWLPGRPAIVRLMPLGGASHRKLGLVLGEFVARTATSVEGRQWPPLVPYAVASERVSCASKKASDAP